MEEASYILEGLPSVKRRNVHRIALAVAFPAGRRIATASSLMQGQMPNPKVNTDSWPPLLRWH